MCFFELIRRLGFNKWLFTESVAYQSFVFKNKIKNARGVDPVRLNTQYNVDMRGLFKNADGSEMLSLPDRSAERRVGNECRCRLPPDVYKTRADRTCAAVSYGSS